ncbi:hypothetical protein G6F35_014204 [Rhizopus arrhizus]|nr:hypothetical protein G6F35_014204 [Rhizopus arrhizus]
MAIGVTELTAAGREVENYTFRTFEAYAVVTVIYLVLSQLAAAADRAVPARTGGRPGRHLGPGRDQPGPGASLRRAAGAGPHQPLPHLLLAVLGSGLPGARPAASDVHLLGVFLRAAHHWPPRRGHHDDGGGAGLLRKRVPGRDHPRRHPGAAPRPAGSQPRAGPVVHADNAARDPAAGALQHAAQHAEPVRVDGEGDVAGLCDQRAGTDLCREPDQQRAADQAVRIHWCT